MDEGVSWPWLDFAGGPEALERLVAELADTDPTGAEEREAEEGVRLRVYWPPEPGRPAPDRVEAACAASGARLAGEGSQPREDWLAEWKRCLRPLRVSRRLWVRPPWEAFLPPEGEHALVIEPGMAFGTGHHATTRLCLELLDDIVRPGDTVLDVGSGSGILAMAAVLLAAGRVVAVEVDPEAAEVARENLRLNGVEGSVELVTADFGEWEGPPSDHVVCNMILARLEPILPALAESVGEGWVVLSGIEEEQGEEATARMRAAGLEPEEIRRRDGWRAYRCRPVRAAPSPGMGE
jgi:ribosomal protein L11 methyltransferase